MSQTHHSTSFFQKYQLWLFIVVAAIIRKIPLLSTPFNWLESYFHEISHGIAALVTGGKIVNIQLFLSGAGLCTTQGGNDFLITFSGYAGAIVWGALIYAFASQNQRVAKVVSYFILALLACTLVLWAKGLLTMIIITVLIILFLLKIRMKQTFYVQKIMQLSGMLVLLNGLFSPWYLFDGRAVGDGARLAELTYLPELFWVVIWSGSAVASIFWLNKYKGTVKTKAS
jgi:hypothetical protein